ncbi:MAG: DUF4012 domain-containing protein [Patescibacteria group bacterium]|nr:DUF4012 domain-containing protein [Patescibacteria group bacterium]
MDEFRKIDLVMPSKKENQDVKKDVKDVKKEQGRINTQRRHFPKAILIILLVLIVLGIASTFTIVLPLQKTISSANKTYKQANLAMDALKKQNVDLAGQEIDKTRKDLAGTQNDLKALSFLKYVPIANWYYSDADHLLKAGSYGLDAASTLVESIKPYQDVLGLKGKGSFVMGSAEQRVQTAVMTMSKITPRIDDIAKSISLARKEIDEVDPNHYPSILGGDKIKKNLQTIKTLVDEGEILVTDARPLIKALPDLLGEKTEKKYLVLFLNDKELRPTGGFITAYAILRIDKGVIHFDNASDIYNLDNTIMNKPKAPEPILKYLPKVYNLNLRDSNLSPDFIESMKTFESLYNKSSGKVKVDGIIAIDTSILVSTIKILDDEVYAGGIKFTSKIDKRCDCPEVIYVLEDNISRPVNYVKGPGRKDLLGVLMYAIMEKALKSSPGTYWGPLFQELLKQTNEKHVLFYVYDKDAQTGIEALNAAGRVKSFDGDYFYLDEANFGGQKSNMYIKEDVEQKYEVKSDGSIIKTITVNYKNPYPPSDCNEERGNLCLNAVLRDWFRVYVPKGSEIVDSVGSEVKISTYEEFGKTVLDGFLTVKPLGTAKLTISYKLPFKVKPGSSLPLLIQKQPGTYDNTYTIKMNGRQVEQFKLTTDKEVKLRP